MGHVLRGLVQMKWCILWRRRFLYMKRVYCRKSNNPGMLKATPPNDMKTTLLKDTKITLPEDMKTEASAVHQAWSTIRNLVFCWVVLVSGLEVITILIKGPPRWYEEQSHIWIPYSDGLASLGDCNDRICWLFMGRPYKHAHWWVVLGRSKGLSLHFKDGHGCTRHLLLWYEK